MTNNPRVGVVGAGSLGFHHIRILRDLPGIRFTGFVETRPERSTEVVKELGVKSHDSLEDLLAISDAVIIVVPTSSHFAVASAAIERAQTEIEPLPEVLELIRFVEASERGVVI